jgi:site-specific recombinase XerD
MAYDSREMLGLPELLTEAGCRALQRPWHALRHTFASHFVMAGGNILSLQKILGHSDIKMTLVYAHLAPDFLGEEMNRLRF